MTSNLWVDKHRPHTLVKLHLHHEVNKKLSALALSDEIPHLLVYGPAGTGKKTRVMCLLREIYGSGVEKVKLEHRTIKVNTSGKVLYKTSPILLIIHIPLIVFK